MKKTILLFSFYIMAFGICFGQTIISDVTATAGDYSVGSNINLSWTVGIIVTETFTGTGSTLAQGFQAGTYKITIIEEKPDISYQISIYPNPTDDLINIVIQTDEIPHLKIELIDINGKQLLFKEINNNNSQIRLSKYPNSIYFLKIYDSNNGFMKSFKIQKVE